MLIALLAVLGVDLITIVALIALVVARRRWLKRQPGEFVGAVRVSRGEIDGLSPKWKRGSGRWVRNVLVWSKGSLRLRNCLNSPSPIGTTACEGRRGEAARRLTGRMRVRVQRRHD